VRDNDYSEMTLDELRSARQRLVDDLEDYEEMAAFHSVNSPAHATSTERQAQSSKIQRMTDAIAELDRLLATGAD
jgi:hypothetical protein